MIFSSVQSKEDLARCPQAIQKAVLYAMQTDFDALEDGRQEIDGDRMFANLFHLTSQPAEKVSPEGHKEYADVQFWLSGEEWCGVAPRTGKEVCVEAVSYTHLIKERPYTRQINVLRGVENRAATVTSTLVPTTDRRLPSPWLTALKISSPFV